MNVSQAVWDGFLMGAIFGISITLLLLIVGIAIFVRVWGAFTIGPPTRPLQMPSWLKGGRHE